MTDMDNVLVINAGSSSVKFQLFGIPAHDRLELRVKGRVRRNRHPASPAGTKQ